MIAKHFKQDCAMNVLNIHEFPQPAKKASRKVHLFLQAGYCIGILYRTLTVAVTTSLQV